MHIPDKIYLQIKDEDGETPDEVTWCIDRIHDTDIEYVRAANDAAKLFAVAPPLHPDVAICTECGDEFLPWCRACYAMMSTDEYDGEEE